MQSSNTEMALQVKGEVDTVSMFYSTLILETETSRSKIEFCESKLWVILPWGGWKQLFPRHDTASTLLGRAAKCIVLFCLLKKYFQSDDSHVQCI